MQRYFNHALLLLLAMTISACAQRAQPLHIWNAEAIVDHDQGEEEIKLHAGSRHFKGNPQGNVVVTINLNQVRNLMRIKQRVEDAAGELHTELLIAEGNDPNGFSLSHHDGQYIAVNIGMLNLLGQDEDAAAALLGHELAHLYLAHGQQRRERENDRALTTTVIAFAVGMVGIPFGAVNLATGAVANSYSREEERDADRLGVSFIAGAGFDPWGAVRLQEKMAAASGGSGMTFLSTHPSSDERIENMKQLAQELQ